MSNMTGPWLLMLGTMLLTATVPAAKAEESGGMSADAVANANNPLADMNALNFQNYYVPKLYGVTDASANAMNLRGVMVAGRQIIRATLPVATVPTGAGEYASGLGDLNVFDAIVVYSNGMQVGIGPLLVIPTDTDDALGASETWQAGLAGVFVKPLPGGSMVGGLATWQTDVAGSIEKRVDTNLATAQLFLTMSVGGGWYFRSTPLAVLDFENDNYMVPFGLGAGKVFMLGKAVVNVFAEPQFTVYHDGTGQPSFQLFSGLNLQFPK